MASPERRQLLGVRRPVSGLLGVYLFPPFGLGPSPGWDDKCVREVLRVDRRMRPSLLVIDSVGDLRLVEEGAGRVPLFSSPTQLPPPVDPIGGPVPYQRGGALVALQAHSLDRCGGGY